MDVDVRAVSAATFFGLTAGLGAVGVVSWWRTRRLRHGRAGGQAPPGPWGPSPTSRLTWLAAWAGASATVWGMTLVLARGWAGLGLVAGGGFVALTGTRGRITAIQPDADGLTVLTARGRPFAVTWPDVDFLCPPRTPLSGWRIDGRTGARTLMPSDLWGSEGLLSLIAWSAGLQFDGRLWRRG